MYFLNHLENSSDFCPDFVQEFDLRQRFFAVPHRTVQCTVYTFSRLFVLNVYAKLFFLPRFNCTVGTLIKEDFPILSLSLLI
jgi:hypothetical protein